MTNTKMKKKEVKSHSTLRAFELIKSVAIDLITSVSEYKWQMIEDEKPETKMTKPICEFGTPNKFLHNSGGQFQNA